MAELTFISNKTQKETYKYFVVIIFAVITWVLQISIFSRLLLFDTLPNIMLLGSVYSGLIWGPLNGTLFGIVSSFLSSSILYDHLFYFSYPLIGLLAGLLTKNLFSDELLFFILLCFLLSVPLELLNGFQYGLKNPIILIDRYVLVCLNAAVINLCFSYFFYFIMKIVTKRLK